MYWLKGGAAGVLQCGPFSVFGMPTNYDRVIFIRLPQIVNTTQLQFSSPATQPVYYTHLSIAVNGLSNRPYQGIADDH